MSNPSTTASNPGEDDVGRELERLSKAAQPGPWRLAKHFEYDGYFITDESSNLVDDVDVEEGAFIVALVNALRSGKLVASTGEKEDKTGASASQTGLSPDGPTASRSSGFAAAIPSRGPAEVTLADCPVGLFWSNSGELCVKTEYGDNSGRIDAFIVSSGEYFCGDPPQTIMSQRRSLVTPIDWQFASKALTPAFAAAIPSGGWPKTLDSAPKDGTMFLAHYNSEFGPRIGPMHWTVEEPDHKKRRFHSWAMLTETGKATHWEPLPAPPSALAGETAPAAETCKGSVEDEHATRRVTPDQTPPDPTMTVEEAREANRDAIKFAISIDDHYDRLDFLRGWIEGDVSEWPEFRTLQAEGEVRT